MRQIGRVSIIGAVCAVVALTLYTNQVSHSGVWGLLHNKSVKPKIELRMSLSGTDN